MVSYFPVVELLEPREMLMLLFPFSWFFLYICLFLYKILTKTPGVAFFYLIDSDFCKRQKL